MNASGGVKVLVLVGASLFIGFTLGYGQAKEWEFGGMTWVGIVLYGFGMLGAALDADKSWENWRAKEMRKTHP